MSQRERVTIIISLAVVLVVAVVWFLTPTKPPVVTVPVGGTGTTTGQSEPSSTPTLYLPSVPQGATLSVPVTEAPASMNQSSDAKARFFKLEASASGFSPSTFTVNRGDTIYIDFTAIGGSYDLTIPYLGASFAPVAAGETKRFPFDTNLSGTFTFECQQACPKSGLIKGSLIVLPS